MNTQYYIQMFARLEPETPWQVGRVADTDVLSLDDAARFASKQAGTEILPADFLRAASRGEISLKAIVHHGAKLKKHDGGIYCNQGLPTENTTPKGAIPTLPLSACQQLANAGRASWRTYDGFESVDGELMRFTIATLDDGEPDFETVPTDCRVTGWDARAIADAFMDKPATKDLGTSHAAFSGAQENEEQGEIRRRGVFVAEVISFWPTIEQDLSDSGRNGLHDVAKHQDHGFWKVKPAIKWAAERGKIAKGRAQTFIASNEESHLSPMLRILLKLD